MKHLEGYMSKHHYPIDAEQWLTSVAALRGTDSSKLLQQAVSLYDKNSHLLLEKGLGIADILLSLGLDNETLASALSYPAVQVREIHLDSILECLGEDSRKLLNDVLQMQSLDKLQHIEKRGSHQIENVRKMLLAMVTDVRAVLIVLAERLWQLRQAKQLEKDGQQKIANETLAVYAPLANRLGVWQLKWEIEDLCLRYLVPDVYMELAKKIASKRNEREAYVDRFIAQMHDTISQTAIKDFQVTGRVKHIYSIYKKMQRKNTNLEKIYDMSAIRVLVNNIEDCYSVLGILQSHWSQVPEEFDDYISQPKSNGYQSIHTVLIGPDNHYVEVQIRTYQMHKESELGVAAHWRYKEGVLQASSYEEKIALLRQIIAWQKEVINPNEVKSEKPTQDLFADRIYVFTPTGDIIDLPKGATPLDFAYTIHSEVGHRCRGAKVDGSIVPLTYELVMGQRVEILTAKQPHPSRDWLNPHRKFLKTARARAKVQHWFKVNESIQNAANGRELIEKELKRLGVNHKVDLDSAASKLNYKNVNDMLTALSAGELRISQITHILMPVHHQESFARPEVKVNQKPISNIQILGVSNLLTNIARCCKPLPGDSVIGYVTRNRGVTIHRRDCKNMINVTNDASHRMIEVNWGEQQAGTYPTDLLVRVYDRSGILRDITTLLATEKINVSGLQTQKLSHSTEADILLTIDITHLQQLKIALEQIRKLPNVIEVRRR